MSDFLHFLCWFACVFISAFCAAELTGEYWYFQSAAMSLLLPLCLSLTLGSFLFLGVLNLLVGWSPYARIMKSDSMARVSQTNRAVTWNGNIRTSRSVVD